MSDFPDDHQTSIFMSANTSSFKDDMQPDAVSAGRLLSTSEEDANSRVRMSRPAKTRVRIILGVFLGVIVIITISLIAILATSQSNFEHHDQSAPLSVPNNHVRCYHDVIISDEPQHQKWRHFDSTMASWKHLPDVKHHGFVIISPKYKLEAGYPGILISLQLPPRNTKFHIMAVTPKYSHSKPVTMSPGSNKCDSIAIDDPKFFNGEEVVFRIYIYYKSKMELVDMKSTVTALPTFARYKSLWVEPTKMTTKPNFAKVRAGVRDHCSLEIKNQSWTHCNWWNLEDGDNAEFILDDSEKFKCVSGGVESHKSAVFFLGVESTSDVNETRALLVSPVIMRDRQSITFTLWYMFKCSGPHLRIHLIPARGGSLREAMGSATVVAEITKPARHLSWKFKSFEIKLPNTHAAYHLVLEGIIRPGGNCSIDRCTVDSSMVGQSPERPLLGLDSLTIDLMNEQCNNTGRGNAMDCSFQKNTSQGIQGTMCEWTSSYPEDLRDFEDLSWVYEFRDWKTTASGGGSGDDQTHGATRQHLEGRGHIVSFDATGKYDSKPYVRTPLLIATNECSCSMQFLYLMRGFMTPRMMTSLIYGADTRDETREKETQWSLLGHQSDDWEKADIQINLRKNEPFQIEISVMDVVAGQADVHFDDIYFIGCDMKKYE